MCTRVLRQCITAFVLSASGNCCRNLSDAYWADRWDLKRHTPVPSLHRHILAVVYQMLCVPEHLHYFAQHASTVCTEHLLAAAQHGMTSWRSARGSKDGLHLWCVLFEDDGLQLNMYLLIMGRCLACVLTCVGNSAGPPLSTATVFSGPVHEKACMCACHVLTKLQVIKCLPCHSQQMGLVRPEAPQQFCRRTVRFSSKSAFRPYLQWHLHAVLLDTVAT